MKQYYTMDDFVAGLISVYCKDEKESRTFMKMCEQRGLLWNSGDAPTNFIVCDATFEVGLLRAGRITFRARGEIYKPKNKVNFCDLIPDPFGTNCRCFVKKPDYHPDEVVLKPHYQIIIDCKGNETTARMMVNGKQVKTSKAKRNPADKFDWKIGAQLAFDRLWEKKAKKEPGVFHVGDRVVAIDVPHLIYTVFPLAKGSHGKVVKVSDVPGFVTVRFDEPVRIGNWKGEAAHIVLLQTDYLRHE